VVWTCLAFFPKIAPAQPVCATRYTSPVFTKVDTMRDVAYGKNVNLSNVSETLKCDIYQPSGDTSRTRPLLILIHGGAFITGNKSSDDVIMRLCREFALRGYVSTSINYRLGVESILQLKGEYLERATYRAVQDAKAVVRFFRSRADVYRIDTNLIFEGGTSAGAITAVHHAYLDQNEAPVSVDTIKLGNIEGASGNPGWSSRIRGVINCWGAIGDTIWMKGGDVPIVSVHGLTDSVVSYDYRSVFWGMGMDILRMFGSVPIHLRAQHVGIYNRLKLFDNTGHGFPQSSPLMDTTIAIISSFLGSIINCDSGALAVHFPRAYGNNIGPQWRIQTSPGSYVFITSTGAPNLEAVDCAGRIVPMQFVYFGKAVTIVPIKVRAAGMYYLFDKKNRNLLPAPVFLSGR
jgi:hypothetical protein